ncbi:MAG TPA: nucleoside phosphorylase [Cyclobacteriaceae bacterium]|nr:nucleoside phosphorylase [Cyclobacteriaceae bacterium]
MSKVTIPESELVLNPDGSVYHLHLKEEHIGSTIILVGDQGRVEQISKYFDKVEFRFSNREFITHTGLYKGHRITVISTGIGTDNVDIVVNELDAAVNIDLKKRQPKEKKRKLNMIRIGTSGALQADIPVDSFVVSTHGLGLDGLLYYYRYDFESDEKELSQKINQHLNWNPQLAVPYIVKGSDLLIEKIGADMFKGITATASGFYGPQGRSLRLEVDDPEVWTRFSTFAYDDHRITNFEMETSALFGLGKMLGHDCVTCCAIVANRVTKEFSHDHAKPVKKLIETVLERVVNL